MSNLEQDESLNSSAIDESQLSSTFSFKFPLNDDEISKLKDSIMSQNELIKIVEIQNCPTTSDASKLLSNSVFRSVVESLINFTILKLKIDEKLNENHAEKPRIHEFNIARNFLISFESTEDESQKIIYWKNAGRFITIKLIEGFSSELTDFVRNFLIDIVDIDSQHSDNPELIDLIDSNGFNLLMKAVDLQETTLIDELLYHPFYINKKSKDGKSAADIAWQKKNFEILILLLEANSIFPKEFNHNELDVDDASNEIEEFLKISNEMHKSVKSNDSTKVLQIINEKSNLSCFYNSSNVSAATIAIKSNKPEIYKLLTENECIIGPEEDFNQIIEQHQEMKSKITTTHDSASKQLQERHLMILLTNSVICHDNDLSKLRRKRIKEAFNILNEIPLIRKILILTAMHKNFKIRFDFNRSSVEFMNPSSGDYTTRSLCQKDKSNEFFIYIGAKDLLNENEKFSTIGTLAHALCHFAMNLIFINDGKPYAIDDQVNADNFNKIIEKCKQFEDVESIVKLVYNYSQSLWPSELIVRVPHMTAFYKNDSQRLDKLKATYKELFNYYDQDVEPKIVKTQSMLCKLLDDSFEIKWNDLTDAYKALIHHSITNFQGIHVTFNEIINDKNSAIFQLLTSEQIRGIIVKNSFSYLMIGQAQKQTTNFYADRDFVDLDYYNFDDIEDEPVIQSPDVVSKTNEINKKYFKNFDQLSFIAETSKMILLSDLAGAGKTTTFQHFATKLKKKFKSHWVSYVDLKRHFHIYEKFEHDFDALDVLLEILESNEIEKEIFKNLFKSNRVILLYDGVDEIAPKFNKFFVDFIESVRNSTANQQWIATRPQHMKELMTKFDQKAYKLKEYNKEQQIEFIQNVLINLSVHKVDPKKIIFAVYISTNRIRVDSPLMLQILTEIYVNDKSILREMNSYSIFDRMIDIKKDIIEDKGKIVGSDRDNRKSNLTIWQVHQIYALKLLYSKGFENHLMKNKSQNRMLNIDDFLLLKRWKNQKSKWTSEAISRYGFLIVDNWNTNDEFPDFYHRSFADFFVAQFLIEDIYELEEDEDVEMTENDLELRVKLLFNTIKMKNDVQNYILSFVDSQKPKAMNKHFFNFITSKEMQKLMQMSSDENITLFKILSFDERFLKEFKLNNRLTIFQKYLTTRGDIKLVEFFEIFDIYERSLGAEWAHHTGYDLKENFSLPSDDEIVNVGEISQNKKISELSNDYIVKKSIKIYKLLCFIGQTKMTKENLKNFFEKTIEENLIFSFKNLAIGEKLLKIIESNSCDLKSEFGTILHQKFNIKSDPGYLLIRKEYHANALDFCQKLEKVLCSDEALITKNLKIALLNILVLYCGIEIVFDLQKVNLFTKIEIQDFIICHSVKIICRMCESKEKSIEDFMKYFKDIFENDKAQLMDFLKMQNVDSIDIQLDGQTVLSFLIKQIVQKNSSYYNTEKCIILKDTFIKMAKEVGITDDEIESVTEIQSRVFNAESARQKILQILADSASRR